MSESQEIVFATNGGMFEKDFSPKGLYIENKKEIQILDTKMVGYGNFYLQPNGVLSVDENHRVDIVQTQD